MLMGFTPAGQMEDFFTISSKQPVDAKIAEAHGIGMAGAASRHVDSLNKRKTTSA